MRHRFIRTSLVAAASIACAAATAPGRAAAQNPDYGAFTATQFIPFAQPYDPTVLPFSDTVGFRFLIGGRPLSGTMDTGTTGVMLSAASVPGYTWEERERYEVGWEFLSSSKLLWVGRWIPQDLVFTDSAGRTLAVAHVPVLAVELQYKCPGYERGDYGPTCPDSVRIVVGPDTARFCRAPRPVGTKCYYPPEHHVDVRYFGVGFGREHDGQPQGIPDRNPLLNITMIGDDTIPPGTMRSGYIITARGVHVGLTRANTAGVEFMPLRTREIQIRAGNPPVVVDSTPSPYARDWGPATVCVSVDAAPCATGAVLIDAGVDEMFLTVPSTMPLDTIPVIDPSTCIRTMGLAQGSRVQVIFPGTTDSIAAYSFVVGDSTNYKAPSVVMPWQVGSTFVNTGRHLFRAFDVAFDADSGYFGLRALPAPQGAPTHGPDRCARPAHARIPGPLAPAPGLALPVRRDTRLQRR